MYTEEAVLAHHGIDAENGLAYLRDEIHLVALCQTCASIVVAPDAASRVAYSQRAWDCCGRTMVGY